MSRLHVLFIVYRDLNNPSAVGGDIYLWELARGLFKLGHRVTILCSSFPGSKSKQIIDGVEIVRLKGAWSLPLEILKEYQRRLKGEVDVVVEEAIGGQRLPTFGAIYVKEPLIAVWHQKHDKIFREQYPLPLAIALSFFEFFLARLYRNQTIVTPSKGAREKLMPLGFRPEKIRVVYDGVDSSCDGKTLDYRERLVVFLGKLRRYKRPDHAILALEPVVRLTKLPVKLVIAGKASEIDRGYIAWMGALADKLGVGDFVTFMINISEEEKQELLSKARILVQPSPVEGFSIVVAEANRCGTPVVASDGVPKDVVVDGLNGLVYPFGDIDALVAGIVKLMDDDVIWKKMSESAREWSGQFTWETSVLEFQKVLNNVVLTQKQGVGSK